MTKDALAKSVFGVSCLSQEAQITFGGVPAGILTEAGRVVRLAVRGDDVMSELGHHFPVPFANESFRSMMHPGDPVFMSRKLEPNFAANLEATQEEREALLDLSRSGPLDFKYRVLAPFPNLEPKAIVSEEAPVAVRRIIERLRMQTRSSLIDHFATALWALSHRPSPKDFLIVECFAAPWDKDRSMGYVQFKGCGGSTIGSERRWVYAESESVHQKEENGKKPVERHPEFAQVLGWKCREEVGNDSGIFLLDGPLQAAMLAELVVDTLIVLHGLEELSVLDLTLTRFEDGESLKSSITIPKHEPTMGEILSDDLMDGTD
jgi:hypothetical protein